MKNFETVVVETDLLILGGGMAACGAAGGVAATFNAPIARFSARVGNKEHHWTGRIVRTHASVDQQTRLIYAVAEVEDPYGLGADHGTPMAVGMFVNADIAGTKYWKNKKLNK